MGGEKDSVRGEGLVGPRGPICISTRALITRRQNVEEAYFLYSFEIAMKFRWERTNSISLAWPICDSLWERGIFSLPMGGNLSSLAFPSFLHADSVARKGENLFSLWGIGIEISRDTCFVVSLYTFL